MALTDEELAVLITVFKERASLETTGSLRVYISRAVAVDHEERGIFPELRPQNAIRKYYDKGHVYAVHPTFAIQVLGDAEQRCTQVLPRGRGRAYKGLCRWIAGELRHIECRAREPRGSLSEAEIIHLAYLCDIRERSAQETEELRLRLNADLEALGEPPIPPRSSVRPIVVRSNWQPRRRKGPRPRARWRKRIGRMLHVFAMH